MDISNAFGLIAGIIGLIAYGLYLKQAIKNQSTPNPTSWGIWFLIGLINAITYFSVTNNDYLKSFLVIAVTVSVLVILVYSFFKGRFSKISIIDAIILILAIVIGIFWQVSSNDRISNLLLQGVYIVSYIPTYLLLIRNKTKEHYPAWTAAFTAYLFSTISLIFSSQVDWIAYVHPIVNGLLGNGIVIGLILYNRRRIEN